MRTGDEGITSISTAVAAVFPIFLSASSPCFPEFDMHDQPQNPPSYSGHPARTLNVDLPHLVDTSYFLALQFLCWISVQSSCSSSPVQSGLFAHYDVS